MAAAQPGGTGDQILVIEDEGKIARLLVRALTAAGFGVTSATSGLRGLSLAQSGAFNLVILDLMLPDVDGLSILASLVERGVGTQVLVLSALGDVHSKVRCLEVGACDYVTKPFDLPELVARVRLRIHERRDNEQSRFLQQEEFGLDLRKRTVTIGDRIVGLSTREFVLLEYLMRRSGEVCPRTELLEQVWGYTFDPATNVLDVYVARLRNKLGGDSIQTVRNVGYAFVGA
jgi:two-component system OmpR family response regulator